MLWLNVVAGALAGGAEAVLDLVVPRTCAGCGADLHQLCPSCLEALAGPATPALPSPCPAGLPTTWAVAAYDGAVRSILLAHKEKQRLWLARPLGLALARSVAAAATDASSELALVPVPSSRAATRRRGHDPLLRCARAAAHQLRREGRPVAVVPALSLGRRVDDQSDLGAAARAANLDGAHRVRPRRAADLGGRVRVVLVDDLVTTGVSLAEAARALRSAGVEPVGAAVVAATRRRLRLDRSVGSA